MSKPTKTQVTTERGSETTTFFFPEAVMVDAYPDGTTVIVIRHGGCDHVLTFEPEGGPLSQDVDSGNEANFATKTEEGEDKIPEDEC